MTDRLRRLLRGHDWHPGTCGFTRAYLSCRRCGRYERTTTAHWHRRYDAPEHRIAWAWPHEVVGKAVRHPLTPGGES